MKRLLSAVLACVSLLPAAALPRVAVLDILAPAGMDPVVIVPVTETIMEEVVSARAYTVLDRAYVEQVLKEMEFDLSGLVNEAQAAKAGQFLNADYVVTGKVQALGESYFLVAKMIEVRTGVIVAQASDQGDGKLSALLGLSRAVGRKLVSGSPVAALEPAKPTAAAVAPAAAGASRARVKAGFIFPMALKDENHAIVAGMKRTRAANSEWLDTVVLENVAEGKCAAAIDRLVNNDGCGIVIGGTGEYALALREAASKYPSVRFVTLGGDWQEGGPANFTLVGINDSQHWYLEGLVAGALTASNRIGIMSTTVGEAPWQRGFINRFALGVKAANSRAKVIVHYMPGSHWGQPALEESVARALVAQKCDFIWGEVTPQVYTMLESLAKTGKSALSFQTDFHYSIAPSVIASGPMRDYAAYFQRPLDAVRNGAWVSEAYWDANASVFGGGGEAFNPAVLPELRAAKVRTPDQGTVPLLDLLTVRAGQIASGQFEPFTGPIRDQNGVLRLKDGVRADWQFIDAIDWYVDNVTIYAE